MGQCCSNNQLCKDSVEKQSLLAKNGNKLANVTKQQSKVNVDMLRIINWSNFAITSYKKHWFKRYFTPYYKDITSQSFKNRANYKTTARLHNH